MDWTTYAPIVISTGSLAVAGIALWRTFDAARPRIWLELQPTTDHQLFRATVHLRNFSSVPVRIASIAVPLKRFPVDRRQDLLVDVANIGDLEPTTDRGIKLDVPGTLPPVPPGELGTHTVLFQRGPLSKNSQVKLLIGLRSSNARPRHWVVTVRQDIPGGGMSIGL